jgi:signal transduction histidine kinase
MSGIQVSRFLLPQALVTVPVFATSLALMALLHFLDSENYGAVGAPGQRALLLVIVQFVAFAVPAMAYFSLRHRLRADALTIVLIVSLVIGVIARAYALNRGLQFISGQPIEPSGVRVVTSITNVALAFISVWAVFSWAELHRRRRQRLLEEQEQVLRLREQVHAQLDRMDAHAAEVIRTRLMESVVIPAGGGSDAFTQSVRRLIDDVVRPMSRYFDQQSSEWLPPEPIRRSLHLNWRAAWRAALTPSRIHPLLIIAVLAWTSLPNTLVNRGPLIALVSAAHLAFLGVPLLMLVRWICQRCSAGRRSPQQAAAFFIGLYAGGQILGLTSYAYTQFQEPRFFYAIATPIYVVIAGVLIALAQSAIEQSRTMDEQLRASTEELRWSLARARETHRAQRRALAHALHGKVQAALASAILRLETSDTAGPDRDEIARTTAASLKSTIANVDFLVSEAEPLEVVLHRIHDTWEGIADVTVRVANGLSDRIANDPVCAVAVNDLLTELTFNSIKHGSASLIDIQMQCPTNRTLEVAVVDNGRELRHGPGRGLGSALLDDCAISWQRTRVGDETRCAAVLPIQ